MSAAELYRFAIGAEAWTYTSADAPAEHNGETYAPIPIDSDGTEQTAEINRSSERIRVPRDNPIGSQLMSDRLEQVVAVTIYRRLGDLVAVRWKGRVMRARASGSEITLECESIFTALRQPGLRGRYQRSCRHTLYGRGCNVDKSLHAVPGTIKGGQGPTLIIPQAGLYPNGTFYGGLLETTVGRHSMRMIIAHEGSQIVLSRPIDDLDPALIGYGMSYGQHYGGAANVIIYPGCDRSRTTCYQRFNNIPNFGGFPWIPGRNPFDGNSIL